MAGREPNGWHPVVEDFILIGCKLEKLGFIYGGSPLLVS